MWHDPAVTLRSAVTVYTGLPSRDQLRVFSRGLLAESFDPALIAGQSTLTSQQCVGQIVGLYAGDVVTNIVLLVTTAAVAAEPTNFFVALYDLTGVRLAISAEQKSNTGLLATGFAPIPLAAAYTVPAGSTGCFYAAVCQNGAFGTPLQIARANTLANTNAAVGSNSADAVVQTGQATPPSPATFVASTTRYWIGVS